MADARHLPAPDVGHRCAQSDLRRESADEGVPASSDKGGKAKRPSAVFFNAATAADNAFGSSARISPDDI